VDPDPDLVRDLAAAHREGSRAIPLRREVERWMDDLLGLLFPQLASTVIRDPGDILAGLQNLEVRLCELVRGMVDAERGRAVTQHLFSSLGVIREQVARDAEAILAGDPAAESLDEVISAYPGFLAMGTYRVAHHLHHQGLPVLPRLFAEVAHARTGIDIHPGASIGRALCIDHGTGIVVGETAVIGDDVKLYQGVTLGALSVAKNASGTKRHPTIEDRVVIYANATVLGGETVVGHDSVVGGNVWLTNSVGPYSLVYHSSQVRVRQVGETLDPPDFVI
jgi:serine O-acetyltransferase